MFLIELYSLVGCNCNVKIPLETANQVCLETAGSLLSSQYQAVSDTVKKPFTISDQFSCCSPSPSRVLVGGLVGIGNRLTFLQFKSNLPLNSVKKTTPDFFVSDTILCQDKEEGIPLVCPGSNYWCFLLAT